MITPKAEIFDRIGQSFDLFIKFIRGILLPVFFFYFLFGAIYSFIATKLTVWYLWDEFFTNFTDILASLGNSWEGMQLLTSIISNPKLIVLGYGAMLIGLIVAILFIPVKLGLIRGVKQWFNDEDINIMQNIRFWFSNILPSFRTYWYIFAYVYLLPSLTFIALSLVYIILLKNSDLMEAYSWTLITISIFTAIFFIWYMIYRWLKATFALFSAVDNDSFTIEDFQKSLKPTNNNLWRIFWNILLFWIIISFASSFIWWVFNTIIWLFWATSNFEALFDSIDIMSIAKSEYLIQFLTTIDFIELARFSIFGFIVDTWWDLIKAIWEVLVTIFVFIFYKRLELESTTNNNTTTEL